MRRGRWTAELLTASVVFIAASMPMVAEGLPAPTSIVAAADASTTTGTLQSSNGTLSALIAAQSELADLEAKAQLAQRRFNDAITREHEAAQAVAGSRRTVKTAQATADRARQQLGRLVAAAYRSGVSPSLSALTLVLDAHDADDYLHGMQQTQRVVVNGDEVLAHAATATKQANAAQQRATANLAALTAVKNLVARTTADATNAVTAASQHLDTLGTQLDGLLQQQASAAAPGEPAGVSGVNPNALLDTATDPYKPNLATRAVNFALAQLGKPYLWGGTGPGAFDCSGLTMRAYQAAGVTVPHFAAFQYATSHPLSLSQIKPGDLLFWATKPGHPSTIYHEAIYLGGSLMVQAPKTNWKIQVSSMWMWGPIQFFARPY